jgi:colanic acid/amylovoran biosynthesis glycosyltransferase
MNPRGTLAHLRKRRTERPRLVQLYLDAAIVALRPSVVHFEFGALALGRLHLGEVLRCPTVVSFRGYDINFVGLDVPNLYEEVWTRADAVHFVAEALEQVAGTRGFKPTQRHAVIPVGIDVAGFHPVDRPLEDRPLRILSIGRLAWTKGYEYSLAALAALKAAGVRFEVRILGEGDFRPAVIHACEQFGLGDDVELAGNRPAAEVPAHLAWADVLLHGAVSEGFSNAVAEAQASGLPVVTSDAGGLPENAVDGVTAFVVPRRDPAALANKLQVLAEDPDLRARMGTAGRIRVEEHLTVDHQMDALGQLYRSLLDDRVPASPR